MSKIQYIEKRFNTSSRGIIERANSIIAEYDAQGFSLTLRQLYYQFVARGFLANKQQEYKRLGSIINDARLAGLVDWQAIEDRTRNLKSVSTWDDPEDIVNSAASSFRVDKWADQPYRPEVWIEKEALVGVIDGVCSDLQVSYFACRGYSSQSEQWRAGQRFTDMAENGQIPVVLHLGDHDPSGIDMTRDNKDRLALFLKTHGHDAVIVKRLALNMDQVRRYKPPPNPAKMTDSRVDDYIRKFGKSSWELDALDPPVIAKLITDAVALYRDEKKWKAAVKRETAERDTLATIAANYADVATYARDNF